MTAALIIFGDSVGVFLFFVAVCFASLFGLLLVLRLIYVNVFRGGREPVITIGATKGDSHERR